MRSVILEQRFWEGLRASKPGKSATDVQWLGMRKQKFEPGDLKHKAYIDFLQNLFHTLFPNIIWGWLYSLKCGIFPGGL